MATSASNNPHQLIQDQFNRLSFQEASRLLAKLARKYSSATAPSRKDELLRNIRLGGPGSVLLDRMNKLNEQMETRKSINEREHQELLGLVQLFETWAVERFKMMVELAELESISVDEVGERYDLLQIH